MDQEFHTLRFTSIERVIKVLYFGIMSEDPVKVKCPWVYRILHCEIVADPYTLDEKYFKVSVCNRTTDEI